MIVVDDRSEEQELVEAQKGDHDQVVHEDPLPGESERDALADATQYTGRGYKGRYVHPTLKLQSIVECATSLNSCFIGLGDLCGIDEHG